MTTRTDDGVKSRRRAHWEVTKHTRRGRPARTERKRTERPTPHPRHPPAAASAVTQHKPALSRTAPALPRSHSPHAAPQRALRTARRGRNFRPQTPTIPRVRTPNTHAVLATMAKANYPKI
ncbi:hypothetical protein STEG23_026322 [Scotinomys teguina]